MRTSPLRELTAARGAVFGEGAGVEIALSYSSVEEEYRAVREAVGLTDFSFATRFRIPEEGLDMLEQYAAGAVAAIRFGRVLHTLAASPEGTVESDLYVANDDEHMIVLGESLIDDDATAAILSELGGDAAGLVDISSETALIGLDGLAAWSVARELFGADVLGLPYLSVESYELDGTPIKLIRGGKTSEFGYLLLVEAADAVKVWELAEAAGARHGIRPVGLDAHQSLRLDGRFFNIHAEGAAVRDPLPLGLQWMLDFEGDDFRGKAAIMERRAAGLSKKIIGVVPEDPALELASGQGVFHGGDRVAEIVTATPSPVLGKWIGLALFDVAYAYSGLGYDDGKGNRIRTISMPPFTPRSLTVKLDEM